VKKGEISEVVVSRPGQFYELCCVAFSGEGNWRFGQKIFECIKNMPDFLLAATEAIANGDFPPFLSFFSSAQFSERTTMSNSRAEFRHAVQLSGF
jgi:hypothetical protein